MSASNSDSVSNNDSKSNLSQHYIDLLESKIANGENKSDKLPLIGEQHKEYAQEQWKLINESPVTHYYQFASAASGYTSYGFYKAINGKIYIVEAYLNSITDITELIEEHDVEKWLKYQEF